MAQREPANESDPLLLTLLGPDETERERFSEELTNLLDRVVKKHNIATSTEPEDIRQDALLSILEQTKDEKLEKKPIANIIGYAVTSAINLCKKTFRRTDKQAFNLDDETQSTSILSATVAEAEQEIKILNREKLKNIWEKARDELSVQQLSVFLLDNKEVFERLSSNRIVRWQQLAETLEISRADSVELRKKLPLDDDELANYLGVTKNKVYQLRFQVNKWLKKLRFYP